jgi:outer membrane protein OmpA-like peptidoglycan-associated protein
MTFKVPFAIATAAILGLTACQAPLPGQTNERTVNGAIIGGLVGGIAGAASGPNDLERAAVGAAIGAGIGAAIGNNLDRQAAELRQQLGDDRIRIVNTGNELVVTMPQDILFASDSAALQPALQSDLRALARNLQNYPDSIVQVIGHTDNTASAAYNQDLSERRASSVANVLISAGVAPRRIAAIGRGEDQPIASNLTPGGRAQNRRVEIIIRPTT